MTHIAPRSLIALRPFAAHLCNTADFAINWNYLIKQRPITLAQAPNLPKYLLLPEVERILDANVKDGPNLMIDMLWHTGARVSELLAITPSHLYLESPEDSFVSLEMLKPRKRGRPRKTAAAPVRRKVPLADPLFIDRLRRYLATYRPGRHERLFSITPAAVDFQIKRAAECIDLPLTPSARTFRHSFAVNAVLHACPAWAIQRWLGHKHPESTEIYTQVLESRIHHHQLMQRVAYSQETDPVPVPGLPIRH